MNIFWYYYPKDLMYLHIRALIANNRDIFKKYSKKDDIKKNLYNIKYIIDDTDNKNYIYTNMIYL